MKLSTIHTAILILLLAAGRVAAADETNSPAAATATATNGTKHVNLSSFQSIGQHNIFDPNRRGYIRSSGPAPIPVRIESFSLRGTMLEDSQKVAFFDGSSSQFNKVATTSDTIAGYKIAEIGFDHVKLAAAGNQTIKMAVGSQMRRRDNGPWSLEINGEPAPDTTTPAPTDKPAASGHGNDSESDVIKRLMKKHEAENN